MTIEITVTTTAPALPRVTANPEWSSIGATPDAENTCPAERARPERKGRLEIVSLSNDSVWSLTDCTLDQARHILDQVQATGDKDAALMVGGAWDVRPANYLIPLYRCA